MGFQVATSGQGYSQLAKTFKAQGDQNFTPIAAGHHTMKRVHLFGTNDISFHDLAQVNTASPTLPPGVDKWGS